MRIFQKYALDFDVDRYIDFAIDDEFRNKFNDGIAVSFWYKGMGWGDPSKYDYLVHISSGWINVTVNRASFRINNNKITFHWGVRYYKGVTSVAYNNYNDGLWHHYVGVVSEDYMKLFVDGMLVDSVDLKASGYIGMVDLTDANLKLSGYTHQIVGSFGEVRVYDRPLTPTEIQYLYNGGHIEDGLVFWLYPDEDSVQLDSDGQTVLKVYDKVNGYEGTVYNGVKLIDGKDVEVNKRIIYVKKV